MGSPVQDVVWSRVLLAADRYVVLDTVGVVPMRAPSKSQVKRYKVQKDPKHLAKVTKRHESAVKYNRKVQKEVLEHEITESGD